MDRTLALFAIGLVFGGGIGFVVAAGNGITFDGHDHGDPAQHAGMDHASSHDTPLEIPPDGAPLLSITVMPDELSGYNLYLKAENFDFAPRNASREHVAGEGHAHIYVNGEKVNRLYSDWYHLSTLPAGEVEVQVTLNTNDHRVYSIGGQQITATTVLTVD